MLSLKLLSESVNVCFDTPVGSVCGFERLVVGSDALRRVQRGAVHAVELCQAGGDGSQVGEQFFLLRDYA